MNDFVEEKLLVTPAGAQLTVTVKADNSTAEYTLQGILKNIDFYTKTIEILSSEDSENKNLKISDIINIRNTPNSELAPAPTESINTPPTFETSTATEPLQFNELPLTNDTTGTLLGKLTYAQNITIYHTNPLEDDIRPHLVAQRDTLIMFQPRQDISANYINVIAYDKSSKRLGIIALSSPLEFPRAEQDSIVYLKKAWTAILPRHWINPGLKLHFQSGVLLGVTNNIIIGAANELIINIIDIGMLVEPRNQFTFADNPSLHRDYFQKIPVSHLIVAKYEPIHIGFVILPNGVQYHDHSATEGSWHGGDMRQYIGKVLISHGINMANYGIHSSNGVNESAQPYLAAQITAHNSRGKYINGVHTHGGSGGNGMATIEASKGNEWSHEIGHNFKLAHYPGNSAGSIHRRTTDINSAWGWDSFQNRFIANFFWDRDGDQTGNDGVVVPPYAGHKFNTDAMAGGYSTSPLTKYTLHTPYALHHIQKFLEGKIIFDKAFESGFKKWNSTTNTYDSYHSSAPLITSTLNTQSTLNPIKGDTTGAYLSDLFKTHEKIDILLADGAYVAHIYSPAPSNLPDKKILFVKRNSGLDVTLHINGSSFKLAKGESALYITRNKNWVRTTEAEISAGLGPTHHGVPVTTIVGYYDPEEKLPGLVYDGLHGGYGFVYPVSSGSLPTDRCVLKVYTAGWSRIYFLHSIRINKDSMNKFHVNIPQISGECKAEVLYRGKILAQRTIKRPTGAPKYSINGISSISKKFITSQQELTPLNNNPDELAKHFNTHFTVSIRVQDGAYIKDINLPGNVCNGQHLIFERQSGYEVNIHLNPQSIIKPERGSTTHFLFHGGVWSVA